MQRTDSAVRQIAEDAARAMFWAKVKMVALILAGLCALGGGAFAAKLWLWRPETVAAGPAGVVPAAVARTGADTLDWDSPISVVAASIRAAMTPDPEKYREMLWGADADEQRLADAMVEVYAMAQELNDLAKARFGPEARLGLIGSRDDMPRIDTALWQVKVEGDAATVTLARGLAPRMHRLRRVDGKWKLSIYETMGPAISPGVPAGDLADRMTRTAAAMRRTADELLAGRFETVEEARLSMQMQSRVRGRIASTVPARP